MKLFENFDKDYIRYLKTFEKKREVYKKEYDSLYFEEAESLKDIAIYVNHNSNEFKCLAKLSPKGVKKLMNKDKFFKLKCFFKKLFLQLKEKDES